MAVAVRGAVEGPLALGAEDEPAGRALAAEAVVAGGLRGVLAVKAGAPVDPKKPKCSQSEQLQQNGQQEKELAAETLE